MPEDTSPPRATAEQRATLAKRILADADFKKRIEDTVSPYVAHISENIRRATALIEATLTLTDASLAQDVLRAAVVLNHAYLEDLLRTLAGQLLPEASEEALNDIPLAGSGGAGHVQKFQLGSLAQHKGKTVDRVIHESIAEHLDRATYNDTSQISRLLVTLGFNVADHNRDFPKIQKMMQRRHQIVHRADRVKAQSSDTYTLQPVDPQQVYDWLMVTATFVTSLMQPLFLKLNPLEDLAKILKVRFNVQIEGLPERPIANTPGPQVAKEPKV